MNKEEALANADIMKHFGEGKPTQWRPKGMHAGGPLPWKDITENHASFDFQYNEYRKKPQPEKFFITVYGDAQQAIKNGTVRSDLGLTRLSERVGVMTVTCSLANAKSAVGQGGKIYKVTEVTEEE